jgi:cyclase
MRSLLLLLLLTGPALAAPPVAIADGVYVIIHTDATTNWPQGNTTIVIGTRGVLVVDSAYLPSAAVADIAAIQKLTKLPVRYLVNTHWHYDHVLGNAAYRKAFPSVDIVAHEETRRILAVNAVRYMKNALLPDSPARKAIAELKAKKDRTPAETADIAARERELVELAPTPWAAPTLAFSDSLTFDLGGREVRVLHLGRGNTPGDTVVHLPKERIVMSGDLVVAPVPYAWNSLPKDWVPTLEALRALDPAILVPGHGPIMRDLVYLRDLIALLRAVNEGVARLAAENLPVDEVRKRLDLAAFRDRMAGTDPGLLELWQDSIMTALVERAFQSARGAL